jgi:SAM-dependent methyltransferase
MIHEAVERAAQEDLEDMTTPVFPGGTSVTAADRGISAQARSLQDLDRMLDRLARRDPRRQGGLLDLGCGMGALATHIGGRLGLNELTGVDLDPERLKGAAARGVRPLLCDLNDDTLPLPSGSMRVVSCFGLLAYLNLYDNTISEAARVLEDGGWFLLSMPNLASYANRLALLLGYQPHAVAVSRHRQAGTIGRHRDPSTSSNMPPLLHGATLRCMREVLDDYGFDIESVRGFAPGPRRRPVTDGLTSHIPSLSRRFLILARKRPVLALGS